MYYNFSREVTFGEKQNLLLLKVSPADSGDYECVISANVGRQNQNHKVSLIVNGKFSIKYCWQKYEFSLHMSPDNVLTYLLILRDRVRVYYGKASSSYRAVKAL